MFLKIVWDEKNFFYKYVYENLHFLFKWTCGFANIFSYAFNLCKLFFLVHANIPYFSLDPCFYVLLPKKLTTLKLLPAIKKIRKIEKLKQGNKPNLKGWEKSSWEKWGRRNERWMRKKEEPLEVQRHHFYLHLFKSKIISN